MLRASKTAQKMSLCLSFKAKSWRDPQFYTDGWKAYDGLILNSYNHYRIFYSQNEFARVQGAKITSMASNLSGLLQNDAWLNLTASRIKTSSCTLKNPSLNSIIGRPKTSLNLFEAYGR